MTVTPERQRRSPRLPGLKSLRQQIQQQPRPEPEDSRLFRIVVQLLASIGIISIDLAAADATDPLWISLWAVPVSFVGAGWSWYHRRHRNVPVKFCIAIGMLLALGAFFVNLLRSGNDTRLALAQLLIWLQVLHSFDLPRRKDLGYSMVIGLILLGVSATLSQTLWFGPLVLLFLAIAIPALILDYRSRLGLIPREIRRMGADLAPRRLGLVLLIVAALGLLIFAFLPRLPGYQLRTFPVSTPIEVQGEFDQDTIINPGYVRQGRGTDAQGSGTGDYVESGPGEVDDQFYYGFNTRINQNLRGSMTPQTVMRVRSQSSGFWRVMAFDRYTGQGWEVSRNDEDQIETLRRPNWTFRFNVPWSVTINRLEEVIQSFTIVADLPNLIPAMYEAKELYFPTEEVAIDKEGTLRSPVPLSEGLTYTVVSAVPRRNRTRLQQSDLDYPDRIRQVYLQVPEAIADPVRRETERILAAAPNPITVPYEKALYLAQYLKQNYTLQPDLPFLQADEDLVNAFLFDFQGGYPDHFSTVLTVMLRSIGIPARLVVGFGSGEFNPFTGFYVVRNTDAFAMTEVYFSKFGWFAFNPIPGTDVIPPSVEETETFSTLKQFWRWVAGWLPSPVTAWLSRIFSWIGQGLGWVIGAVSSLFSRGWVGLLIGLGGLTGAGFLGWLGFSGWQSWRYQRWLNSLPPMEAIYQQMIRGLAGQGLPKSKAQTPLEYAQTLRPQQPPLHATIIDEISQAYVHWRYGGVLPNLAYLRQQLKQLRKSPPKI